MTDVQTTPAVSGRQAAHLLRVVAIARERELPLLGAVQAAGALDRLPQIQRLANDLKKADDTTVVTRFEAALAAGRDAPAAAVLAALARAGLPAEGLRALAGWLAGRSSARHRLFQAVSYPVALMAVGVLIYSAVFHGMVLPSFMGLYSGLGARLPLLTRIVTGTFGDAPGGWSTHLVLAVYLAVAALAIVVLFHFGLRVHRSRLSLYLPYVRQYLRFDAARSFAATLDLLLEADTPLPEAIRLAAATVESPQLRQRLEGVVERVANGDAFGECLRESGALPPGISWRLWSAYYRDALTAELGEVVRASTAHLQVLELKIVTSAKVAAGFGVALTLAPIVVTICALYLPMFSLISQIG